MGGGWPIQRRIDDLDDTDSWIVRRNADVALRQAAEAVGRDLWDEATRKGQNLSAAQPSDLIAIGTDALNRGLPAGIPNAAAPSNPDDSERGTPPQQSGGEMAVMPRPEFNSVLTTPPSYRFATAGPGDSISRLLGTSAPGAIGRFVSLNGLGGQGSTLKIGRSYAVPTRFDDASPDEVAIGKHLLRSDNARLAAARALPANDPASLFAQRLNAGLNVWTGEAPDYARRPGAGRPALERPWWDQSAAAKGIAGGVAYVGGAVVGVPRAAKHAVEGIVDLAGSGLDLAGVRGAEARRATLKQMADAGRGVLQYARAAVDDPAMVVTDVRDVGGRALRDMSPLNAPMSGSLQDVVRHQFSAGENLGETATNIVGTLAGGEVLGGLRAASTFEATRAANIAKFIKQGASPKLAEYLAEPYVGMGHHAVAPRRVKIPESILGIPVNEAWAGQRLPRSLSDSPFNVSKPPGMSRGDFYEHHYGVDRRFHGARLPADLNGGKGWSGKKLGLRRYGLVERSWKGTPVPTKGAAAIGAGLDDINDFYGQENPQ